MEPTKFEGANVIFGENQPEYLPLPAKVNYDDPTVPATTCWQLTPEERLEIFNTGKLYLRQLTFGGALQPILPSVTPLD